MAEILNLSRRAFLRGTAAAGGGLVLGYLMPGYPARAGRSASGVRMGAWIRIGTDGSVTISVEKSEMGQGVFTALPMLVAEELEVAWEDVRVAALRLEDAGHWVSTGGSTSVRSSWEPLSRAGAAAREMLVAAAAQTWGEPASECAAQGGRVLHRPSGRALPYAALAERAARLPVPESPRLKPNTERRLIGRPLPRLDTPAKVSGAAVFGIDVQVPGMLHAAVLASPVLGGEVVRYDEDAARAVGGVRAVVEVPGGVAVVADHYWQARKGLLALSPVYEGGDAAFDSESYSGRLREALDSPGLTAHQSGDPDTAFAAADKIAEARYEVPFLAHATMEPMNCTARASGNDCEIWAPTQNPSRARAAAADALGVPPERVQLHTTLLGGGFGRRQEVDFVVQAVLASKAVGRPVKLIWSREEDIRHDFYRPAYAAELRAALDEQGMPIAWTHHVAGASYRAREAPVWARRSAAWLQKTLGTKLVPDALPDGVRQRLPRWVREGVDGTAVAGSGPLRYRIPCQRVEYSLVDATVPVGWWRSVGHSQNAFFTESFVDELSHAAGRDPYEYRRALLAHAPRERRVLDVAAQAAEWSTSPSAGRGRGIAFHPSFGSLVAQVAEVSLSPAGTLRVHRVVCAIDCGQVVNPDTVRAQMEGGILFGLTAALRGEITLRAGAVEQSSFHDYRLLALAECPAMEVHIVESNEAPGGVGEPGTPPIAPAIANAVFAATGRRLRKLPLAVGRPRDGAMTSAASSSS